MKMEFSKHITKNKVLLKKLICELSEDFEYVSILATDVKGKNYEQDFATSKIEDAKIGERGYVARIYNGTSYSEYSFDDFGEVNYIDVKSKIIDTAKGDYEYLKSVGTRFSKYSIIDEEKIAKSHSQKIDKCSILSSKDIMNRINDCMQKAKSYSKLLINATMRYEQVYISKAFYSTNKDFEQAYMFSTASMMAVVRRGEKLKYAHGGWSTLGGIESFENVENSYKKLIDAAIEMLSAEPVEPGEYEVICDPDVAGLIAHEAFGHGVEMDMFVKNRAKGKEYVGEYVASKKTVMHDGAASAKDVASYLFDDEGTLGTDTKIIDNGILKAGISDLLSAMQLGTRPTGNGRRESFERKVYARMTNTFFAPGEDDLDEMIASIKFGYLLESYDSGMEDPKNWGIQCMISRGREIIDGKLTGKVVGPILLSGYVPDILKSISMISNTPLELAGSGYCGKGYKEWAKTSIGGTYLKAKARLG